MNQVDNSMHHRHCDTCVKIDKCDQKNDEPCKIVSCRAACGAKFHGCKEYEHHLLCPNVREACINSGYGCPQILMRKDRGSHLQSCPASTAFCKQTSAPSYSILIAWAPWPKSPVCQDHVCFQNFRRDEISKHIKNWHGDIGFEKVVLEERCPLAGYGCTYVRQRIHPNNTESRLVFSTAVRSLAEIPADMLMTVGDKEGAPTGTDYLSALPLELLEMILSNLDGFSLRNLVITSRKLREVAQSLLLKKNIASTSRWKKTDQGWRLAHKHKVRGTPSSKSLTNSGCTHARVHSYSTEYGLPIIGSFGVIPPPPLIGGSASSCIQIDYLSTILPDELLKIIASYLDNFSLNNLALTSRLLREVARSFLRERGMVNLRWEKSDHGWRIAKHCWSFSPFSPVERWMWADAEVNNISKHLEMCEFQRRNIPVKKNLYQERVAALLRLMWSSFMSGNT